jgi:dienelactone hydrolase
MHKLIKILVVTASVIGVIAIILVNGKQPQAFAENSESANRLLSGPLMVRSHDEVFIDSSRESQAHGDFAGSPSRRLEATIWHPADNSAGPYPLIVYNHGFSSMREGGAYLAEYLASYGYVVVAANFPLTTMNAPDRPYVKDVVNQPGDVSFLIDSLLAQSNDPQHMLQGMVDEQRIGVTGISLGGMTTTLVAFHPTMADHRVKAALSIAGPTAQFTSVFFESPQVPFLMLAGNVDVLVPYASNAAPVVEKVPGGQLVTVLGASHTGFAGPSASLRWMNNPDALGCYVVNQSIEDDIQEPWFDLLGTPEQGIDYNSENELCQVDPLPEAMNPLRQQMIAAIVVRAFFDSILAEKDEDRAAAGEFLSETLAAELTEVEYARATGP